jgi:hypothetical protein
MAGHFDKVEECDAYAAGLFNMADSPKNHPKMKAAAAWLAAPAAYPR